MQVDYSSEASLEKALEGVQVIISTLGHSEETLKQQAGPVIQAAKAAGVQVSRRLRGMRAASFLC